VLWAVCFYLAAVGRVPWFVPLIGFAMYGLVLRVSVKFFDRFLRKARPPSGFSLMLGVKCDDRESLHGSTTVAWRRTLGWEEQLLASSSWLLAPPKPA
jgi:hypothetical protein